MASPGMAYFPPPMVKVMSVSWDADEQGKR
jgi:hypothetical protein